jgi:hypothetical protein
VQKACRHVELTVILQQKAPQLLAVASFALPRLKSEQRPRVSHFIFR